MRIRAPFPKEFFVIENFDAVDDDSFAESLEDFDGTLKYFEMQNKYLLKSRFTVKGITQEQVIFTAKQFIELMSIGR